MQRLIRLAQSTTIAWNHYVSIRSLRLPAACTEVPDASCWKCQKSLDSAKEKFFCGGCDSIQPPVKCANYFQYLDIPLNYNVDTDQLQSTFKQLQGKLHPDRFAQRSTSEKLFSDQQSSLVNLAYRTLLQPLDRANYLLRMVGQETGEETSTLDPKFLMEMLELNEAVEEMDDVDELQKMGENAKKELARCQESLAQSFHDDDMSRAKAVTDEMRYYLRIKTNVDKKLGFA
uniref:J domain-containing protein n=1 Tax=Plectus sambesii TaxID=2011161 RepID=A0A914W0M1_9BILA